MHDTLHAQASPCDSCMTLKQLLGKWGKEGDALASFQLLDGEGVVLVDHVRRIARETIYGGDHPRQALRVVHNNGGRCRDTIIAADRPFILHRSSEWESEPVDIPILPAREFLCKSLLSPNSIFIGGWVGLMHGSVDKRHGFLRTFPAYGLSVGGTFGRELELVFNVEVITTTVRNGIPLFLSLRWSPLVGKKVESALHYAPNACQFIGPKDRVRRPPKSVCAEEEESVQSDSSVFAVEERWTVPVPYAPFLYVEIGVILGGDALVGSSRGFFGDDFAHDLKGFGVGATLVKPFIVSLGYRHSTWSSHTLIVMLGAELW